MPGVISLPSQAKPKGRVGGVSSKPVPRAVSTVCLIMLVAFAMLNVLVGD